MLRSRTALLPPYFLILDSDDTLDSNCVEALSSYLDVLDMDDSLSGIIGNKFDMYSKKVIGSFIPREIKRASGIELYQKYRFTGETLRLYKTSILKKKSVPFNLWREIYIRKCSVGSNRQSV